VFAYVRVHLQRIDCVHEARRGWDDKGVHVLDADDGLSIEDLAPSEVKSRVMTYCERFVLALPPSPLQSSRVSVSVDLAASRSRSRCKAARVHTPRP
jgi:hypothetical protein